MVCCRHLADHHLSRSTCTRTQNPIINIANARPMGRHSPGHRFDRRRRRLGRWRRRCRYSCGFRLRRGICCREQKNDSLTGRSTYSGQCGTADRSVVQNGFGREDCTRTGPQDATNTANAVGCAAGYMSADSNSDLAIAGRLPSPSASAHLGVLVHRSLGWPIGPARRRGSAQAVLS